MGLWPKARVCRTRVCEDSHRTLGTGVDDNGDRNGTETTGVPKAAAIVALIERGVVFMRSCKRGPRAGVPRAEISVLRRRGRVAQLSSVAPLALAIDAPRDSASRSLSEGRVDQNGVHFRNQGRCLACLEDPSRRGERGCGLIGSTEALKAPAVAERRIALLGGVGE